MREKDFLNEKKLNQAVYQALRGKLESEDDNVPLVFGLKTCYSSAFLSVLLFLLLLAALVLMDGMALPLALLWLGGILLISVLGSPESKMIVL